MAAPYPILARLCRPDRRAEPAVDAALLAAIDLAGAQRPDEQADLIEAVIARRQDGSRAGLVGVISRFHALAPAVQEWLADRADQLAGGLRSCIAVRSAPRQTRANAIALLASGRFCALAPLAASALSDVDETLVNAAAAALTNFVQRVESSPDNSAAAEDTRHVAAAVGEALATFAAHQRLAVLDCAIRLADELAETIRPMLAQPGHPTAAALAERVTQSLRLGGSTAQFYFLALSVPATRQRFAGRIGAIRDRALVSEMIRQAARPQRTSQPGVVEGLAAIRQMAFMNQPDWWRQLDDESAGPTVRWIALIGADPASKLGWLTQLAAAGSPAQQAAARRELQNARGEAQSARGEAQNAK